MMCKVYRQGYRLKLGLLIFSVLFYVFLWYSPSEAKNTATGEKYLTLALKYIQLRNYQTADTVLSKGIQKYPSAARLLYHRAMLRMDRLGKINEAVIDFSRVIRLNSKSCSECVKAYCYRGISLYKLGQYRLAIHDLTKSLNIIPHYNKARVCRAHAYAKFGMKKKAIKDAKLAIKRKHHAEPARQLLKKLLTGRSDF